MANDHNEENSVYQTVQTTDKLLKIIYQTTMQ